MGIVYRAEDPNLDRIVALKTMILSDDAEGRKDYHKRFFLEAKAAGKLTHPHIVTTYDFGEEGDLAYLAMELLEGTDLRERLLKAPLATADAVDIAYQVADGLAFAHERGVVHRDIKPGNIMLLARGQVKIMDFGIARMRSADFKTSTGIVLGTPRFMSPEQIAGEPVDQRSDLFSLGAVLYEALTPAPRAIVSDTRLPLSRQFDSSAALQRVAAKGGRDRERLARAPRPVGVLRRLASDGGPRLLFTLAVTAALAGAYIAFG